MQPKLLTFLLLLTSLLTACSGETPAASLSIPHPDDSTKTVEYFLKKPAGKAPWPTIVLLHGHQTFPSRGGKDFVDYGVLEKLASRGILAVAVSQPGYGNSSGPSDYCGPFTQHAVQGVIHKLREEGLASTNKTVIQGVSRGALTAGLIAARDPSISGLVLISGVYDLPAYIQDSNPSSVKQSIIQILKDETGASQEALKSRSILQFASGIKAASLILNGEKDDRSDPAQAKNLAARITQSGGSARAIIYPGLGHKIPVDLRNKDIDPFIDKILLAP